MASSTAAAYRNSDGAATGKTGQVFTREIVSGLLHLADVPPNLKTTLGGMWEAANRPHGREILFFAAVEGYRVEANWRCRRTVQRHLRRLEGLGIIELVHGSNTIRRPATYRLRTDRLGRRKSYLEAKAERRAHLVSPPTPRPDPPNSEPSSPRPVQSAAVQTPAPPAAAPRGGTHRRIAPPQEPEAKFQITARLGGKLIGRIHELVKGVTSAAGLDGLEFELRPGQRGYREPLKPSSALLVACRDLGIPFWPAREYCERCGLKFDDGDPPST